MARAGDWRPPTLGCAAPQLVRWLARHRRPDDVFVFKVYKPSRGVAERFGVSPPRDFFGMTADELWRRSGKDPVALARKLVGEKIADGRREQLERVAARTITRSRSRVGPPADDDHAVALCSTLEVGRRALHFPMLDFRTEVPAGRRTADRTVDILREVLMAMQAPDGVLLDSGNSYHYYGYDPVTRAEWRGFMQRCLLLEPLVDVRYVAHRLESGRAALRIGRSRTKPQIPHVVGYVGG